MAFMMARSWKMARKTYFFTLLRTVIGTAQPFVLLIVPKYILDELAGQRRMDVTLSLIILYASVLAGFNVINFLINHFGALRVITTGQEIERDNRHRWLYMDYGNFENGQTSELAGRCLGQVNPSGFFEGTLLGFIQNLIQLAGYTYIIASLHPLVILFFLLVIAANTAIGKKLTKIGYEYQPIVTRLGRRYGYIYNQMISFTVAKETRINGASKWLLKKYEEETGEYLREEAKNQNRTFKFNVLSMAIELVSTVVVYGYCAYLAISGDITVGSYTVFLGAVMAFSGSFQSFIGRFPNFALLSKYVDDYKEFLRRSEHVGAEKEIIDGENPTDEKYDIEFRNVSFIYPNTDRYVLKNVNIKVKHGERLSIVGYNFAGKSTSIKLLCLLYEPTEGQILVGGVDISTITPAAYRELLSVVFQDYWLFDMTVKENIVLAREYDEAKLWDAIEKSGSAERVSLLEKGPDTVVWRIYDEGGTEFSGGEAQKLVCARAYYKDAPIVILDEPTAALDPMAESRLYERFNSIIGEKTAVYISHRLASVKFCDSIAVFADGELVERGTHSELMALGGVYAEMFSKQAHYYVAENPDENFDDIDSITVGKE